MSTVTGKVIFNSTSSATVSDPENIAIPKKTLKNIGIVLYNFILTFHPFFRKKYNDIKYCHHASSHSI